MSKTVVGVLPYEQIPVDAQVSLRQLQLHEASALFSLVDNDRDYLREWLPWADGTITPADSEQFIHETLRKRREGSEYGYAIIVDGKPVGHISLMHLTDGKDPEIGYWIASELAGKGITSKAADSLTNFGFNTLGLRRIVIKVQPGNTASNRVAEKLGYSLEGTAQNETTGHTVNVWSKTSSS